MGFFKIGYKNILGYAIFNTYNDDSSDKTKNFESKIRLKKLEAFLTSKFNSGDILAIKAEKYYPDFKKPFLVKYCGGLKFDAPYSSEIDKENYKIEGFTNVMLECLNYFTSTRATKEQINEYNNFYSK